MCWDSLISKTALALFRTRTAFWLLLLAASLAGMFAPQIYPGDSAVVRNLATVIFVLIVTGWRTTMDAIFPPLPWQVPK